MYGFIYNTLRNLVVEKFDETTWREICDEAQAYEMKEDILDRHYYDESYLHSLGMASSKILEIPLEEILEMFGAFFFTTCKKSGHSSILTCLGHNLYGFLMNLDALHDHLSFIYTQMQAPSFRCTKSPSRDGLTLHYYSQRPGLGNIVLGIVKAVASDFYKLDISIKQVLYEETTENLAHHYVYSIQVTESGKTGNYYERLTGDSAMPSSITVLPPVNENESLPLHEALSSSPTIVNGLPLVYTSSGANTPESLENSGEKIPRDSDILTKETTDLLKEQLAFAGITSEQSLLNRMPPSILPAFSLSRFQSRRASTIPGDLEWPISHSFFQACFPFHIIFDKDMVIRFLGTSFARIFPRAIISGEKVTDHFILIRPPLALTYQNIRSNFHNTFIISTKTPVGLFSGREVLQFRGQMVPTSAHEGSLILYLGSPRASNTQELKTQGLYLSNIPVHDVTRDLILLNHHFIVERNLAIELDRTRLELEKQKKSVEHEKQRADQLLHSMLPPSIASDLKNKGEASAMDFTSVTILFSDIKGFTTICNNCKPLQVVDMLNTLYTLFDSQSEKHQVYKVETIGDAYMVAAGLLDTPKEHAEAVTNMAFGMREEACKVMEPTNETPLQIRIGIHTGPVVAGVVGRRMPRYCLFGDTVNTASRMESHGEAGKVHISDETYNELRGKAYIFYGRGNITVKGLGKRYTYFVEPADGRKLSSAERLSSGPIAEKLSIASTDPNADSVSFVDFNQCNLIKVPPLTRQQHSSPFIEQQEDERDSGLVVPEMPPMTKPRPSEERWTKSSSNTSTQNLWPQPQVQRPGSPFEKKVAPIITIESDSRNSNEDGPKRNSALFIATQSEREQDVDSTPQRVDHRTKKNCVIF